MAKEEGAKGTRRLGCDWSVAAALQWARGAGEAAGDSEVPASRTAVPAVISLPQNKRARKGFM